MTAWLQLFAVVLMLGGCAAIYLLVNPKRKPRVLPPPRSKKAEPSYQETDSLAKLLLEVLALKESDAKWPTILHQLNIEGEPHVRTLLLELRSHGIADPSAVLQVVESACIAAKREGKSPSRVELLGRALTFLQAGNSR